MLDNDCHLFNRSVRFFISVKIRLLALVSVSPCESRYRFSMPNYELFCKLIKASM